MLAVPVLDCCSLLLPLLVMVVAVRIAVTFPVTTLAAMDDDDVDEGADTVDVAVCDGWLFKTSPPRCARSNARSASTCLLTARSDGGVGGTSTPTPSLDAVLTPTEPSLSFIENDVGVVMVAAFAAIDDRDGGGVEAKAAPADIGEVGLASGVVAVTPLGR